MDEFDVVELLRGDYFRGRIHDESLPDRSVARMNGRGRGEVKRIGQALGGCRR
jgi:hypothetical protein